MKSLQKIFSVFMVVILCAVTSAEAGSISLTLSQALKMALTRHVDVIMANERVDQALARIKENSSPLLPQLKGTVSETRQTRDLRSAGIPLPGDPLVGPFNVYDARIRLTQTIFDPSAMTRFKASQQGQTLSVAQQKKTQQDVLVLVAALFIDAKRAQDSFSVSQAVLRRDKKELSINFSRFKSGLSSSLELKKARTKYAHAIYQSETAKKEALERRLDLAAALDLPQDQAMKLIWDDQLLTKQVLGVVTPEDQPDMKVAREQLKLNEKDRAANKWDFWPKVSVSGDYGPSGVTPSDSSETYTMGVSATIPIFEGGLRQAKLKESESAVKISEAQLQSVKRNVQARISTQQAIVAQAEALVKENENNVAVAKEEVRLVRSKFNSGNGSPLDVTSADVNLKFAQDQKEEAQAYYVMAKINLARSLGSVEQFLLEEK